MTVCLFIVLSLVRRNEHTPNVLGGLNKLHGCYYPICRGCPGWHKHVTSQKMDSIKERLVIERSESGHVNHYVIGMFGIKSKLNLCQPILDQFSE